MAVVTADFLAGLFTNFSALWSDAFLAAQNINDWQRFALLVPSQTDTETYGWMGTVPQMSQWVDQRKLSGLGAYNYSLRNLHYEASIEVDRDTLEDDKYNQITPRINQLGLEAARFPWAQALTTLINGATSGNNSYDGVAMFATNHTEESSGSQSNKLTGSGIDTLAHLRTDFIAMRTAMRRMKDGRARPMNIPVDLVLAPPDAQDIFEQLINSNLIASNSVAMSNPLKGAADIITDAYLTDVNDWYAMATKYPVKPLLVQVRKEPEFAAVNDPNQSAVFMNRMFQYGVDARWGFGYGFWQTAVLTTNT